jgi:hypothetical protein
MEVNKDILNFLKRHNPIISYRYALSNNENKRVHFILIDDKTYLLHINKKYLVNRIFELINYEFNNVTVGEKRKTIKYYIDVMRLQDINTDNYI